MSDKLDKRLDCDGPAYRERVRQSVVRSLGQDAQQVPVGADTDPVILGTLFVEPGVLGPNDRVEIEALFGFDASAANRDMSIEVNGTEIWTAAAGATAWHEQVAIALANRNSTTSQLQTTPNEVGSVTPVVRTFDSSHAGLDIDFIAQVALESPVTVLGLDRDEAGIVTASGATGHGYVAGDYVDVVTDPVDDFGAVGAEVLTAPDANSFTYLAAGATGASAATTITAKRYPVVTLESFNVKLVPGG